MLSNCPSHDFEDIPLKLREKKTLACGCPEEINVVLQPNWECLLGLKSKHSRSVDRCKEPVLTRQSQFGCLNNISSSHSIAIKKAI